MPRFKPKGVFERNPVADLQKHTLSRIPSIYGRLVYLASLRDPNSGFYRHQGLSLTFGREESARALRESHEQIFMEWLNLPLRTKSTDLNEYLGSLEDPGGVVAKAWLRSQHYRNLVPDQATRTQQSHFAQESGMLLEMIRNAFSAALPGSSQPA